MELLLSYNSVASLAAILLGSVLTIFLLRIKHKTASTWLLTLVFGLFTLVMADAFVMLSVRASWTRFGVYLLFFLDIILTLLIQFAYRFPRNDHPVESNVVLVVTGLNALVIAVLIPNAVHLDADGWVQDFSKVLVSLLYVQVIRLAQYLWFLVIWVRKMLILEPRNGGRSALARCVFPHTRHGKSVRAFFVAFFIGLFMWPTQLMVQFRIISQAQQSFIFIVMTLLLFSVFFIIYINYIPEQTSFLDKLVGITLLLLLTTITFMGYLTWSETFGIYRSDRLEDVAASHRAVIEERPDILPKTVSYVVSRSHVQDGYLDDYEVFAAPDKHFDLEQLRRWDRETMTRMNWYWRLNLRFLQGFSSDLAGSEAEVQAARTLSTLMRREERMADLHLVNLADHYFCYRFLHGQRIYEVGFSHLHFRRFMNHGSSRQALAMVIFTTVLLLLFPHLLQNAVVRPLDNLLTGVRQVNHGEWDVRVPIHAFDEIGFLSDNFNNMVQSIRQAREQLHANATTLREQNLALSQLDRLKNEFLANTSHELRTPLHGIIGLAESLKSGVAGPLPEKARQDLSMISSSSRRLASLVNDILDFSKLRNRDLELQRTPVDFQVLTDVVLRIATPLVHGKKLELINEVPPETPAVWADENRLQQIMINLVGNAIKFTERGWVRVEAVRDKERPDMVEIHVRDTGIGIEPEKHQHIFESFEQAEGSIEREYGGTGLGLAIVKRLVELHGGKVWVHSQKGEGATFGFSLPISQKPGTFSGNREAQPATYDRDRSTSLLRPLEQDDTPKEKTIPPIAGEFTILVVDDEAVNRQVLVNQLTLANYQVVQATSGREALELVDEHPPFDLVLLDIMMPRMSGYEVCRVIRGSFSVRQVPVIFLTAKNQVSDLVTGFSAGANDFLTKPISRSELISRVNLHLYMKRLTEKNLRQERERVLLEAENARKSRELAEARRLQLSMLPAEIPRMAQVDLAVFMKPATEVGGDYYDFKAEGAQRLWIALGDATGHGLHAGTMVTAAKSQFIALAGRDTPRDFLYRASDGLASMGFEGLYMAMTFAELDQNRLTLSSAGMPFPLVYRAATDSLETLELQGLPLGTGLEANYDQVSVTLNPGDTVLMMSDGLEEMFDPRDEILGPGAVAEAFSRVASKAPQEALEALIESGNRWAQGQPPQDDVTLLVLKMR